MLKTIAIIVVGAGTYQRDVSICCDVDAVIRGIVAVSVCRQPGEGGFPVSVYKDPVTCDISVDVAEAAHSDGAKGDESSRRPVAEVIEVGTRILIEAGVEVVDLDVAVCIDDQPRAAVKGKGVVAAEGHGLGGGACQPHGTKDCAVTEVEIRIQVL